MISRFTAEVEQASFKVAQCAVLYAPRLPLLDHPRRLWHGHQTRPALGISLTGRPIAHEEMRLLDRCRYLLRCPGTAVSTLNPPGWHRRTRLRGSLAEPAQRPANRPREARICQGHS